MASTSSISTDGIAKVDLQIKNQYFENVQISVLRDLCCNVIIGHDILSKYSKLTVRFPGVRDEIDLPGDKVSKPRCSVAKAVIEPQSLLLLEIQKFFFVSWETHEKNLVLFFFFFVCNVVMLADCPG